MPLKNIGWRFVVLTLSLLALVGCRPSKVGTITLESVMSRSCSVVFANANWRSDLEIEVIAEKAAAVKAGHKVNAAPKPGEVLDVLKFSEKPSAAPESFVLFYRSCDFPSELVVMVPIYKGRLSAVVDSAGVEIELSKFREMLGH